MPIRIPASRPEPRGLIVCRNGGKLVRNQELSFPSETETSRTSIVTHLADWLARLASSPSDKVSDFPLGKRDNYVRPISVSEAVSGRLQSRARSLASFTEYPR